MTAEQTPSTDDEDEGWLNAQSVHHMVTLSPQLSAVNIHHSLCFPSVLLFPVLNPFLHSLVFSCPLAFNNVIR